MQIAMTRGWTASWLLAATCIALANCAVPPNGPPPPPPPLQPEVMGNPPVTTTPLIWQPGHWDWTGSGYAWRPGDFVPAAGHGNMRMPGYWAQAPDGSWAWQPPHWM